MQPADRSPLEATLAAADVAPGRVADTLVGADVATLGAAQHREDDGLARGTVVGRYVVVSVLGAGTMGVVHAAYDPELDRKVALKLLHTAPALRGSDALGSERLLREAQALARLSHPNVVAIHDVGTLGGEVWMAMEYVDGQTLRHWLRQQPRRWPEVVAVMQAAGHGLAAAHAAGIVHRDLKPDNIMVGHDGRVRVMDFGLARADDEASFHDPDPEQLRGDDTTSRPGSRRAMQVTQIGLMVGTPAYMAPEQLRGARVGAAADVFAFCVSFWEALYGQRPFDGDTMLELAAHIGAGKLRPVPRKRHVPAWLRRVVERGLHVAPERRWPNMPALLAALDHGQKRAHLRVVGGVLAALVLLGGGGWAWQRADQARREAACEAAGASIEHTWNAASRDRLRAALVATGVPYAASTADRLMPWIDRQATAWRAARTGACLDAELRGGMDADTVDRTLWCLDERRVELASLVDALAQADAAAVRRALPSAIGLDPVGPCRDPIVLSRLPVPPVERRAEVQAVHAELARAGRRAGDGEFAEADALARAALAQAETVAWPPLTADAHYQLAVVSESRGLYAEAETEAETAYFGALDAGALDVAAAAANYLVRVVGFRLARPDDGRRWARHAAAALHVVEPEPGLRSAERLQHLAVVAATNGTFTDALAHSERALELYEKSLGPEHPDVARGLNNLGAIRYNMGAYAEARALHERALEIHEQSFGPEHPNVADSLLNLANVHHSTGAHAEAQALYLRALAIQERALGPEHPDVAGTLGNLASDYFLAGATAEARALHERALAIDEKANGPEHPRVASTLNNLANIHMQAGELGEARALFERALAIFEKNGGPEHPGVAVAISNLADVHFALGEYAQARALHERALAIDEKMVGLEHPNVAADLGGLADVCRALGEDVEAELLYRRALAILEKSLGAMDGELGRPLVGLAEVALASKRAGEAVALAERAVMVREAGRPEQLAEARFVLARALWDAPGGDRERAGTLTRQAREALRGVKGQEQLFAKVEQWLARRGG